MRVCVEVASVLCGERRSSIFPNLVPRYPASRATFLNRGKERWLCSQGSPQDPPRNELCSAEGLGTTYFQRTNFIPRLPGSCRPNLPSGCTGVARKEETMSKDAPIGIALLGLGQAGKDHAKNIICNRRASLKWIVQHNQDKAKQYVKDHRLPDTQVASPSGIDHVLADKSVQAVVIATPTDCHEDYILLSLRAGKAVLCEKPIATSYECVVRCYKEAEARGLTLYCAFNRRFDPSHRSVTLRARAGEVGQLQIVKTTSRDSPKPSISYLKTSGGIFHDCGIHDVDNVLNITGEAPESVFVLGNAFDPEIGGIGDIDTVSAMMKFPSGIIGHIDLSRHAVYGYDQRIEIFGSKGMLTSQNLHPTAAVLSSENGTTTDKTLTPCPLRYADSFAAEMEHFLDVITKKAEPEVTKEGVLRVLRVLDAMEKSLKTGELVTVDG